MSNYIRQNEVNVADEPLKVELYLFYSYSFNNQHMSCFYAYNVWMGIIMFFE